MAHGDDAWRLAHLAHLARFGFLGVRMQFDLLRRRTLATCRTAIAGLVLAAAMSAVASGTRAGDASIYPHWKGAWGRIHDLVSGSVQPDQRAGTARPVTP